MDVERAYCLHDGQDLDPEHDLLDQVAVFDQGLRAALQGIVEIKPGYQSGEHPQDERDAAHLLRLPQADLKDEPVDQDRHDRLDQSPYDSQIGSRKLLAEVIFGERPDQPALRNQIIQHRFYKYPSISHTVRLWYI